jgi:hypothetical protein
VSNALPTGFRARATDRICRLPGFRDRREGLASIDQGRRVGRLEHALAIAMAVQFADIEGDLDEIRAFILNDVERIVAMEGGVNYAAAAVIACAYEALARLRAMANYAVFAETLPQEWRPVGRSLYDALRNGIVHGYSTKTLLVEGRRVEIGVSWRDHPHLSFDAVRQTLFLNVTTMAAELRQTFENYEGQLRSSPDARERFVRGRRREREVSPQGDQLAAWQALLAGGFCAASP